MKWFKIILFTFILTLFVLPVQSQRYLINKRHVEKKPVEQTIQVPCLVEGTDTFPYYKLPTVYVYPPLHFKNKKQEKFYWRTVRDVKVVLPLSKYIKEIVKETNDTLMKLPDKRARDKYMKGFEKELYSREEARFKQLTFNQGKLLIRMVDREFDTTSYDLIKAYRGKFRAGFYQLFAKMFGADLKSEFGSNKNDALIERIIVLVENGQL